MPVSGMGNGERDNALRSEELASRIGAYVPSGAVVDERPITRVYLSGPMTGYPAFNFPAFRRAARWLREQGFSVFSPHELGWGDGDPNEGTVSEEEYLSFLREDIAAVSRADMIVLLPGWENSRGAKFELEVARKLGLQVQLYAEIGNHATLVDEDPPVTETVLEEANRLVSHDRQSVYGHPFDDFSKVTGMALALWGRGPETPEEHAIYMVLVKLARLQSTPGHHDSIVDVAGYMKTYDMVIQERLERLVGGTS